MAPERPALTPTLSPREREKNARVMLDPAQRAVEEPCACTGCGLVEWVYFGPPDSLEREAVCPGCKKRQFFKRPLYLDEFLKLPLVMEDRDWFSAESYFALIEHNRLVAEKHEGKRAAD